MTKTADIAGQMETVLAAEENWIQHAYSSGPAYTWDPDTGILRENPRPAAACLLGHIGLLLYRQASYYGTRSRIRARYALALAAVIREQYPERVADCRGTHSIITSFNDHELTTHDDITAVLGKTRAAIS